MARTKPITKQWRRVVSWRDFVARDLVLIELAYFLGSVFVKVTTVSTMLRRWWELCLRILDLPCRSDLRRFTCVVLTKVEYRLHDSCSIANGNVEFECGNFTHRPQY